MKSTYLNSLFIRRIKKNSIKTIVECGSRDCLDAIAMSHFYRPTVVYAFECNPGSIVVCESNINGATIRLVRQAVCDRDELVKFYATDMELSADKNIGASSLLKCRSKNLVQKKIMVQGVRLDTFMNREKLRKIDLLCLDLQGAEHLALEGLGERIKDVRYIITELSFQRYYYGDKLANELGGILHNKGFLMIGKDNVAGYHTRTGIGNALFINMSELKR